MKFENTRVFEILKQRWKGKDMEVYFKNRSIEYLEELQNQINPDYSNSEWEDDFEGGKYVKKQIK